MASFVPWFLDGPNEGAGQRVEYNPDQYITQTIIPVQNIQSELPLSYQLEFEEQTELCEILQCHRCQSYQITVQRYRCGCQICSQCAKEENGESCTVHDQKLELEEQENVQQDAIRLLCPYHINGCPSVLTVDDFEPHYKSCMFSVIKCPYCQIPMVRSEYNEHISHCMNLPCTCKICGQNLFVSQILPHIEEQHPVCQHCLQHKRELGDFRHEVQKCVCDVCNERVPFCCLKGHLKDEQYGPQHYQYLISRFQRASEVQHGLLLETDEKRRQITQFMHDKAEKKRLQISLQGVQLQIQQLFRLQNHEQFYYTLCDVHDILSEVQKADLVFKIVHYVAQYKFQDNQDVQYLIPHKIKFNSHLNVQIQLCEGYDLQKYKEEAFYQTLINIAQQGQDIILKECLERIISHFLLCDNVVCQMGENYVYSDTDIYLKDILRQVHEYCSCETGFDIRILDYVLGLVYYYIINKGKEEQLNGLLLQFTNDHISNFIQYDSINFNFSQPPTYSLLKSLALNDIVLKYTLIDGSILDIHQHAPRLRTKEELEGEEAGEEEPSNQTPSAQPAKFVFYDYVYQVGSGVGLFQLGIKAFCLFNKQVLTKFYPRLLIIHNNAECRDADFASIINLVPSNCYKLHIVLQTSPTDEQLKNLWLVIEKCKQYLQEFCLVAQRPDPFQTIQEVETLPLYDCARLKKVKLRNVNFNSKSVVLFQRFPELLSCLSLKGVEVVPVSNIQLNPSLTKLSLGLSCQKSLRRLFQSDIQIVLKQFSQLKFLQTVKIDFGLPLKQTQATIFVGSIKRCEMLSQIRMKKDSVVEKFWYDFLLQMGQGGFVQNDEFASKKGFVEFCRQQIE